ncbi:MULTISPECIES: hypothetical protein [unclassified Acinetobacter]|uniref:hypothetical protein n=1 Tax=unclassified Acinetobacter TaxID=196816 RepID=UPI0025BA61A4|nr:MULTISPECIES: hypothetical protein [unclassified Acinetobacter]
MKLIKYFSGFFCAAVLCNSTVGHAENIEFQGNIVEFSCAENSQNKDCKNIYVLASDLRQLSNINTQAKILKNSNNEIAQLQVENLNQGLHKVLLINYY